MTESLSTPNIDIKNTNGRNDEDSKVSHTSRFKIMSSRYGRPKTRFGGYCITEMSDTNSGIPKEGKLHRRREPDENSTRQTTSTNSWRCTRSGHSLYNIATEKRSRRVKFYRNGDRFFKGILYAVSSERFRTFESLLAALTSSAVCDKRVMPNGVRHIFSLDGTRSLRSVEELTEGESYVCASSDSFRAIDYSKIEDTVWNSCMLLGRESNRSLHRKTQNKTGETSSPQNSETMSTPSSQSQTRPESSHDKFATSVRDKRTCRSHSYKSNTSGYERTSSEDLEQTSVTPRLIMLIRNGRRPRKVFRLLLNKKTARSVEQVMSDITEMISFDCGQAKKVYNLEGQQVVCLADFFQNDTVFLVCPQDKPRVGDFTLDSHEVKQTQVHRHLTGRDRERTTMVASSRASLKSSRSSLSTSKSESKEKTPRPQTDHDGVLEQKAEVKATDKENVGSHVSNLPMPKVLTNKYEVGRPIGTGNFAVVMECRDRKTKRKYALKIINKALCRGKEEMIDNEVRILRCMKHPNIIRLMEDYANKYQIFYVMELVQGGDLFDAISSSTGKYTEHDASSMLCNLASALQYLHSLHIVHRDVKPENILLKQHGDGTKSLKLGDFGLATEVRGRLYTVCGTPTYVAPEVIAETGKHAAEGEDRHLRAEWHAPLRRTRMKSIVWSFSPRYGLKIDVWSAGVIAYILLCGFPPFASLTDDQDELFDLILTGSYDFHSPHWDDVSLEAKNVISAMLEINPDLRMSATQVLQQKWVSRDNQYEADLRKNVSHGLGTIFRRGPKCSQKHAGIKLITTTALDKASKFFRGRGTPQPTVQRKEVLQPNAHCLDRN